MIRLGNGISPCFFAFLRVEYDSPSIPKSFLFFGENFLLLVYFAVGWDKPTATPEEEL